MNSEKQTLQTDGQGNRRDGDLLRQYVETRSETAFAELVRRYGNLVYATCLRETDDRTLAEDATQGVFLLLSRKAGALRRGETIAGWLYAAARNVARNLMKQERRRRMNEASAALAAAPIDYVGNALWEHIEPHLHDALDRLKPIDREAILLRYVAEQSFAEVGGRLGLSENTARMRVSRAVEKLRAHLIKAGVAVSLAALVTLLEERAAQAAPAPLISSLTQFAAENGQAISTKTLNRVMRGGSPRLVRSRLSLAVALGGALVLLAGFAAYQQHRAQRLNATERRRLFAGLAGVWKGTLEFADDGTHQHFTYPTTVTLAVQAAGDGLEYTATYEGSAARDVTTFRTDADTGKVTVTNGGPQSSHRLNSVGYLVRMRGGYAFEGEDAAMNADTRLRIMPSGTRLTMQEEYRKSGQTGYQFRNRFTLSKQ